MNKKLKIFLVWIIYIVIYAGIFFGFYSNRDLFEFGIILSIIGFFAALGTTFIIIEEEEL